MTYNPLCGKLIKVYSYNKGIKMYIKDFLLSIDEIIGWRFPETNGGMTTGPEGQSAVSTFKSDPLRSIGKENLQNPIDARLNLEEPVRVQFSYFEIPKEDFPAREDLLYSIEKSKEYTMADNNVRVKAFFDGAEKFIKLDKIPFLRISDFNTTGLLGSKADIKNPIEVRNSNWLHLVHGMGLTNKPNGAGGSHGKGKSAAIANSALGTIFYATIDKNKQEAFQGVAFLTSHINKSNEVTQGTGFYGLSNNVKPIEQCISLDPNFIRSETGTDIYIAGFKCDNDWQDRLFVNILNDYLFAIYKQLIIIYIGNIKIDLSSTDELIEKYKEICKRLELDPNENFADKLWAVMKETKPDIDIVDLRNGKTAEIHVFLKSNPGYPKKISMIRQIGMRIYDEIRSFPLPYVGCAYILGEYINTFLASLEDEAHSKWEWTRDEEYPIEAKKILKCILKHLDIKLNELYKKYSADKQDAEGMEDYLPINLEEEEETLQKSENKTSIISINIQPYESKSKSENYSPIGDEEEDGEGHKIGGGSGGGGTPREPLEKKVKPTGVKLQSIEPKKLKLIFLPDIGKYRLALMHDINTKAIMKLVLAGENNDEDITIKELRSLAGDEVKYSFNEIGPINIIANENQIYEFNIKENIRCALGVNVYADKQ